MKKPDSLMSALERVIELEERESRRALQVADLREAGNALAAGLRHVEPDHPAIGRWRDVVSLHLGQEAAGVVEQGGEQLALG